MLADWSVECSADDPVLVVPWSSLDASPAAAEGHPIIHPVALSPVAQFIDLRENPYDLDQIPEAEQHPPLMQALRALNAPRSPLFTAKCDVWTLEPEELEDLRQQLDLPAPSPEDADSLTGFASYIDVLWRDRSLFASFHQSEQLLHRLTRLAGPLDHPGALLDCVLRPALVDFESVTANGDATARNHFKQGYSITLYLKALGPDLFTAKEVWAAALESLVALLRSKDLALA